ncbi:Hsp70 family protein [Phycicoccus sp. 3266]|uniref:Hsp70 family protein n=1 Tax=Phycicoccus sp. 3266 TaxID=2817751 RepID=UPI002862BDA1|nr:Hsp70 family protein [Phycicoccus sp. 3266]MDR6865148.1 molecular chaperone DnaK (HSP70) [Phycicoccus sp. 3266]
MDLGLDFGTTHTVVAHADRGNYPVVSFLDADGDAHDHFPSVAALDGDELVFGFEALEAGRRGAPVVRSFKRALAEPGTAPGATLAVGGRDVPVLDVLTGFFASLRRALQEASSVDGVSGSGDDVRVVLGVPAQAHSAQRFLTLEACRRGGFTVAGMVNEPSAASLEFAHRQSRSITSRRNLVVVYDLGGGTFDTSLVQLDGTTHEVLDSRGVNRLGGDDFDEALADLALQAAGVGRGDLAAEDWAALVDQCREAKERLTPQSRRVPLEVPGSETGLVSVDVADYYAAVTPLVEQSVAAMEPLVATLPPGDDPMGLEGVAGIYLVGGASGLPLVPRLLRERFGRRVHRAPLPSASSAVGLAIAADRSAGFSLQDRLSRGFGVFREREAGAGVSFDPVLDRSLATASAVGPDASSEPVVVTRRYQAAHNVGWFRFVEYSSVDDQGEPRGDLAPVGEVVFPFDPALQQGGDRLPDGVAIERLGSGPTVEERYTVDAAGIVAVTITDLTTGYRQEQVLRA